MIEKTLAALGIAILIALITIAFFWLRGSMSLGALQDWFIGFGAWAPVIYILVYLLAGLVFVPATPLTIAGGVLFGAVAGTAYALLAALCASGAAFLIARHLGADCLRRHQGRWLPRLLQGVEAEGWRFVVFVRLVPVLPFSLVNYGLGLTRLRLSMYLSITAICMLPGTFAYAWLGASGAAALGGQGSVRAVLAGIALLAALALLPRLIRRLWSAYQQDGG